MTSPRPCSQSRARAETKDCVAPEADAFTIRPSPQAYQARVCSQPLRAQPRADHSWLRTPNLYLQHPPTSQSSQHSPTIELLGPQPLCPDFTAPATKPPAGDLSEGSLGGEVLRSALKGQLTHRRPMAPERMGPRRLCDGLWRGSPPPSLRTAQPPCPPPFLRTPPPRLSLEAQGEASLGCQGNGSIVPCAVVQRQAPQLLDGALPAVLEPAELAGPHSTPQGLFVTSACRGGGDRLTGHHANSTLPTSLRGRGETGAVGHSAVCRAGGSAPWVPCPTPPGAGRSENLRVPGSLFCCAPSVCTIFPCLNTACDFQFFFTLPEVSASRQVPGQERAARLCLT